MILRIADPSDPRLAAYRDVGDPAALKRRGLFVAEGRLVVERLLESTFAADSVLATPAAAAAMAGPFARHPDLPVCVCEPSILASITGFDFHRGCLALGRRPVAEPPPSVFMEHARLLALEAVGNPDNVGGMFRTALALGAGGILLDPPTADPLYRKAIRTSMAAVLRMPFMRVDRWPGGLDPLRDAGWRIVALTPSPQATPIDRFRPGPDDRLVLMLGSEGAGLSSDALRYADVSLRIPLDAAADSLNVVVAAGVALRELRR